MAYRVIKEEKSEIDRFIQLNLKVQKKGDQINAILSEDPIYQMR